MAPPATTMTATNSQQLSFYGIFSNVPGVDLTGPPAIRYTSSNPSVLSVSPAGVAQALLEGPQQRRTNRREMLLVHVVGGMALAECAHGRDQGVQLGQAAHHHAQHGHQLLLLLRHVLRKHAAHHRGDLEQAPVEEIGGDRGDRRNLGEAVLDELDLVGIHGRVPSALLAPWNYARGVSPRFLGFDELLRVFREPYSAATPSPIGQLLLVGDPGPGGGLRLRGLYMDEHRRGPEVGAGWRESPAEFAAIIRDDMTIKGKVYEYNNWLATAFIGTYTDLLYGPDAGIDRVSSGLVDRLSKGTKNNPKNHSNISDDETQKRRKDVGAAKDEATAKDIARKVQTRSVDQVFSIYGPQPASPTMWDPALQNYDGQSALWYQDPYQMAFMWNA